MFFGIILVPFRRRGIFPRRPKGTKMVPKSTQNHLPGPWGARRVPLGLRGVLCDILVFFVILVSLPGRPMGTHGGPWAPLGAPRGPLGGPWDPMRAHRTPMGAHRAPWGALGCPWDVLGGPLWPPGTPRGSEIIDLTAPVQSNREVPWSPLGGPRDLFECPWAPLGSP